ncbi:MAG TPA: hypothetical protein PLG43_08395, partial [Spirochaetia bacterium]|nr:hypothetical protein [Spirochaetia bacterium]
MPCFVHRHVLEGCTLEGLKCGITAFVFLFFLCSPHLVTAAEDPALQDQDELYQKTLSIDIDTAGYYELLSWCETLGLDTRGGREELAQRLRGFYHLAFEHVKEEATQDFSKKKGKSITISKAESVQSFTLEIVDETYVRLSGGVILTMKDEETTHIIEADTVVLNQTESTITAFGSIRYTMEKGGKKEYFNGESLTFSIDDLSGFFYKGFSEKNQKIGDKEIIFYYSGNSMYRSSQNIVTLKDGIITSCKEPEPHYSIHATKIWVLAPGEWALKSGTLYLGYVPVAYIPAFFKPGDTFFFNPALGYRSREGYFLQTTTYLLGEKEQTASGISFLQVGDDGSTRYATEREGLFLKKTEAISAAKHEPGKIRLMVDAYSRLGYFTGISADFEDKGFLQSLSLTAGIALSRSLFAQSDGTYSPLYEFSDGTVGSIWNHSNFFGISIPFRYGIDLSFVLHSPHASVTGSIPFYSDKYFKRDFLKRSESMDWNSLLFSQGTTTDSDDLPSTLTLSLDTALTPDISAVKPYIERLELTSLKIALNENSKTNASYLPEEGFFSTFYYPDTYVLPSMNLFMSGTLFSTEGKESAEKKTSSVDPRARQPEYEGMEDETAESAPQVAADESSLRTPFK